LLRYQASSDEQDYHAGTWSSQKEDPCCKYQHTNCDDEDFSDSATPGSLFFIIALLEAISRLASSKALPTLFKVLEHKL
jgi:hypothetical protein